MTKAKHPITDDLQTNYQKLEVLMEPNARFRQKPAQAV